LPHIELGAHRLEYQTIDSARDPGGATLVFMHEGLGSVALWKDFPARVAAATGCNALVYSRYGYGTSTPLSSAREPSFMHDEALVVLPRLLDALGIHDPILFGHSDGASIALIHAGVAGRRVRGAVLMAPHVMIEEICLTSIAAVRHTYETTDLRDKLTRYHADPDGAFRGWCDIWLDPRFRTWNIEDFVTRIACPLLAIQGLDDEYGTMEQIDRIHRQTASTELLKLESCGHSPHRDQPDAVLAAATPFIRRLAGTN
jgi:pimeloyl-ACP methyl ester carboxylesterase